MSLHPDRDWQRITLVGLRLLRGARKIPLLSLAAVG
jgi:hypothetical protein